MSRKLSEMSDYWKNKKVLITGHTGFKGSWLSIILSFLGANVSGFSLQSDDSQSLFTVCNLQDVIELHENQDIRHREGITDIVRKVQPDHIFHLAAQSLVLEGYRNPLYTWEVNLMVHLIC